MYQDYESMPPLPWEVSRYGYSLASIKDGNGQVVIETLDVKIAEFIVDAVNKK